MKQLLQNLRTGAFSLEESPAPSRPAGFVLVANRASLISAGTERSTVQAAQASLLGKARQRPDKVQQGPRQHEERGPRGDLPQGPGEARPAQGARLLLGRRRARDRPGRAGVPRRRPRRLRRAGLRHARRAGLRPPQPRRPDPGGPRLRGGASFATVGAIALQGVRRAEVPLRQPRAGDRPRPARPAHLAAPPPLRLRGDRDRRLGPRGRDGAPPGTRPRAGPREGRRRGRLRRAHRRPRRRRRDHHRLRRQQGPGRAGRRRSPACAGASSRSVPSRWTCRATRTTTARSWTS